MPLLRPSLAYAIARCRDSALRCDIQARLAPVAPPGRSGQLVSICYATRNAQHRWTLRKTPLAPRCDEIRQSGHPPRTVVAVAVVHTSSHSSVHAIYKVSSDLTPDPALPVTFMARAPAPSIFLYRSEMGFFSVGARATLPDVGRQPTRRAMVMMMMVMGGRIVFARLHNGRTPRQSVWCVCVCMCVFPPARRKVVEMGCEKVFLFGATTTTTTTTESSRVPQSQLRSLFERA